MKKKKKKKKKKDNTQGHCISFPESGIMVEDRRSLGLIYWAWFLMKFLEKIKSRFLNFHAISIFSISFKFFNNKRDSGLIRY
jgi:hypothetical protein